MSIITAIDLGSNSFRVLIYDCINNKTINEYSEVVGLADGLHKTNIISSKALLRVIKAIKYSSSKLNFKAKDALCITTAALRVAQNSSYILEEIKKQTGAVFEVITAKQEASLTLLAVKFALRREKISSNKFISLDIGGASTELIKKKKKSYEVLTCDFGIVTLAQTYEFKTKLDEYLQKQKVKIKTFINKTKINLEDYIFISTAGTPTTIAAIKHKQDIFHYDKMLINGTVVCVKDLYSCLEILQDISNEITKTLIKNNKKYFIEVGIYIYKIFFEALNKNKAIVLDDGLKEGIALDYWLKTKKLSSI